MDMCERQWGWSSITQPKKEKELCARYSMGFIKKSGLSSIIKEPVSDLSALEAGYFCILDFI
jgi:hypothetical protein